MFSRGILAKLILLDLAFSDHLLKVCERAVSYTHLTLPTILRV